MFSSRVAWGFSWFSFEAAACKTITAKKAFLSCQHLVHNFSDFTKIKRLGYKMAGLIGNGLEIDFAKLWRVEVTCGHKDDFSLWTGILDYLH